MPETLIKMSGEEICVVLADYIRSKNPGFDAPEVVLKSRRGDFSAEVTVVRIARRIS